MGHDMADDELDISKFVGRYTTRDTEMGDELLEESSGDSFPKRRGDSLPPSWGSNLFSVALSNRYSVNQGRSSRRSVFGSVREEEELSVDVVDAANAAAADATNDRRRRRDRIMYLPIDPHAAMPPPPSAPPPAPPSAPLSSLPEGGGIAREASLRRTKSHAKRRTSQQHSEQRLETSAAQLRRLPPELLTWLAAFVGRACAARRSHTPHRTTAASRDEIHALEVAGRGEGPALQPLLARLQAAEGAALTPLACGASLRLRGFRTGDRSGAVLLGRLREDGHVYWVLVATYTLPPPTAAVAPVPTQAVAVRGSLLSVPESSVDRPRPPPVLVADAAATTTATTMSAERTYEPVPLAPIAEVRCQLRALGLRSDVGAMQTWSTQGGAAAAVVSRLCTAALGGGPRAEDLVQSDATLASWVATKRTIGAAWLAPYRDQSAWWVAVILAQKLTLAFIFGFSRNRRLRAFFLVWLALASTSALLLVRPFRRSLHNGFEIVAWLLLLVIGNIFDSSSVEVNRPLGISRGTMEVGSVYALAAVVLALAAIFGLFLLPLGMRRRAARAKRAQLLAAAGAAGGGGGGAVAAARGELRVETRADGRRILHYKVVEERRAGCAERTAVGVKVQLSMLALSVRLDEGTIDREWAQLYPAKRTFACGSPLDRHEIAPGALAEGAEYLFRLRVYRDQRVVHTTTVLHRADDDAARSRRGSGEEERVPGSSLMKLASSSSLDYNTAL